MKFLELSIVNYLLSTPATQSHGHIPHHVIIRIVPRTLHCPLLLDHLLMRHDIDKTWTGTVMSVWVIIYSLLQSALECSLLPGRFEIVAFFNFNHLSVGHETGISRFLKQVVHHLVNKLFLLYWFENCLYHISNHLSP